METEDTSDTKRERHHQYERQVCKLQIVDHTVDDSD